MAVSLFAAVVMVVGKVSAYWLTGSAAIFSDAAEALVHGVATGAAAFALWYAEQPEDQHHPYGHGKIVYFSVGIEGALILVAGLVAIVVGGWSLATSLGGRPRLVALGSGLVITGALAFFNLGLGLALLWVGRRHESLVLVANGKHVLSDMWIGLGAVFGVGLAWLSGWHWVDGLAGIVVGLVLLVSASAILRSAYAGLMDRADLDRDRALRSALEAAREEGLIEDFHGLRHRRSNDRLWIDVHLLVPPELNVREAHLRASRVERRLARAADSGTLSVDVTSHIEPAGVPHPDAVSAEVLLPESRARKG